MNDEMPEVGAILKSALPKGFPKLIPVGAADDSLEVCGKCLGADVEILEFKSEKEYVAFFQIKPADLDAVERRHLEVAEMSGRPYTVARPCRCAVFKQNQAFFNNVVDGLPVPLRHANFTEIENTPYKQEAKTRLMDMAAAIKAGGPGGVQILWGQVGKGKTYCGIALARDLCFAGKRVQFLTAGELYNGIRRRSLDAAALTQYTEEIRGRHALFILDEFGAGRIGREEGVVVDCVSRLLQSYDAGGWLLITMNPDPNAEFNRIFGDEASRITKRLDRVSFGKSIYFGSKEPNNPTEKPKSAPAS